MIVNLTNEKGIKLLTKDKLCKEDITIIPNLPDAGGGKCDKPHVIEVDVLPDAEAVEYNAVYLCGGRYYKYTKGTLESMCVYMFGQWVDYIQFMVGVGLPPENASYNVIPTKTTDGVLESVGTNSFHVYYIEDEDNIFIYGEGQWFAIDEMPDTTITNGGVISDISEATDTSKFYALLSQGGWKEWIPKEECGGGAELNIAYGDTAPEDTSKLWVKGSVPEDMQIIPPALLGANEAATVATDFTIATLGAVLPKGVTAPAAVAVGKKIYVFGGLYGSTASSSLNTINVFDTETKTITTLSTVLPTGTYSIGTAAVGKKIYLFGGKQVTNLKTINVFDTETFTVGGKKLDAHKADVDTDAAYTPDTEVVADGYFHESEFRSAPYFDLNIDGIELLNSAF
jgi:hypothetical protein